MRFSLSWIVGFGSECKGGRAKEPSWSDIELHLREVCETSGSVTLEVVNLNGFELLSLQVVAGDGMYAMTLGEDNGEDYIVRSYLGGGNSGKMVDILGDAVDASGVCTDFEIVVNVFRQFFEEGRVSRSLMA
ncbi:MULTISPECIES: DUF6911 family protein [Pseudomonas]|uniref:DUF6911 family protein n=1 Tax=Pseudomonas TaxID=286 RepID=UPI0012DE4624|nr:MULTISPECIES: hypothetical protein [Pseudomonas]GID07698.1 hypothetical protein TMM008_49000 [Pseudomonas sp. 008]